MLVMFNIQLRLQNEDKVNLIRAKRKMQNPNWVENQARVK